MNRWKLLICLAVACAYSLTDGMAQELPRAIIAAPPNANERLHADSEPGLITSEESDGMPNIRFPTMGGKQLWTDYRWRFGWRLQKNALTGHYRVLDENNFRHAWGSKSHCIEELEKNTQAPAAVPAEEVVILLHGLMRSRTCFDRLAVRFRGETMMQPIPLEYASTRAPIAEHSAALREVIENLPGKPRIHFVAHSMGNIVVRHAIGRWQEPGGDPQEVMPRLGRMVMLGPPNQGAAIARRLAKTGVFGIVVGKGGLELGPNWQILEKDLAIPPFPFAVIAGRLEESLPKNPLLDSEGDFVVCVEETKLDGMAEFLEVNVLHSFLMDDRDTQDAALRFLHGGKLTP